MGVACKRRQFPLVQASAITVHKSQGGTYSSIVYEYSKTHPQKLVHVALSRCTNVDNLYLTNAKGDHHFPHKASNEDRAMLNEFQRLEQHRLPTLTQRYLTALRDDVLLDAEKKPDFFSCFGQNMYALLRDLVKLDQLQDKTLQDNLLVLGDHYCPKPSAVVQRFRFNTGVQTEGESVSTFVVSLRSLLEYCNFDTELGNLLTDHIVCSINDTAVQMRLLEKVELTFENAVKTALAMEAAKKDAGEKDIKAATWRTTGLASHIARTSAATWSKQDASPAVKKKTDYFKSVCQKLPSAYEEKVLVFHRHFLKLRDSQCYLLGQIGSADQTPVNFDMTSNTTVSVKGERDVNLLTTCNEKLHFTVLLSCLADGTKLCLYIVFKRKTIPKEILPKGVVVQANAKGFMTDEMVVEWCRLVGLLRPGASLERKIPNLLVLNSFQGHLTAKVKAVLQKERTDMLVIPGGLKGQLQPLDVGGQQAF
ncbi:hypothetical protein HPB49_022151 [Dermacentor silvarum]|uniref:Uncharacterized protein n=1 Tax=Dermacentor silvarum TaxID=543639 RepID=A0ACB8DG99_DERSI|nr:hypothetical protein HPB49_022151 [Dermacentor silvarum]